jgi:hypothetical protein
MAIVALIIRLRHQLVGQGLDAGAHTIACHLVEQHQLTVSEVTIRRRRAQDTHHSQVSGTARAGIRSRLDYSIAILAGSEPVC